MTRVGILVECGRDGLEVHLCRRICSLLRQQHGRDLEEQVAPLDNKERLLEEGATVAARLLEAGCKRVVILWDERPAWPERGAGYCWHREREHLLLDLAGRGLAGRPVFLVCIEREFESWLLHDERMLSEVLSTAAHPVKVAKQKKPHRMSNPKSAMMTLFRKHGGKRYVDVVYARRLAAALQDLSRLRHCSTFRRFVEMLTGKAI
jgi:hypothetical protein